MDDTLGSSGRNEEDEMREWIRSNMVEQSGSVLRGLRERVAKIVLLDDDGTPHPRPSTGFPTRQMVLSSFVGKHYALAAGLATDASVENRELVETLSLPKGTIGRCVKELRDAGLVQPIADGRHLLPVSNLERAVQELERITG